MATTTPQMAGKYSQFKTSEKEGRQEQKAFETVTTVWTTKTQDELTLDDDRLLSWLVRYPIERNHPRPVIRASGERINIQGEEVLCFRGIDTIPNVFKQLITQGFSGAPVLDANNNYLCDISLRDILFHTLLAFHAWHRDEANKLAEKPYVSFTREKAEEYWSRFFSLPLFRDASVNDVIEKKLTGSQIKYHPLLSKFSTFNGIEMMAHSAAERIPIISKQNKVTGILTQSMVISLFAQNLDQFGDIRYRKISDMIPGLNQTITIEQTETAMNGFKMLAEKGISGCAVLDNNGNLVDTLSIRDLREIEFNATKFGRLYETIRTYKADCRKAYPTQTPPEILYVTENDTLETLLDKMDDGNIHRIFVCERTGSILKPTYAITQRAVIRYILYEIGCVPSLPHREIQVA